MPQSKRKSKKSNTRLPKFTPSTLNFGRKTYALAFVAVFAVVGIAVLLKTHAAGAYSVVGNKIVDATGNTVIVHGVNRPSLEWSCTGTTVNNQGGGIPATDFATIRSKWNANAVRLPVSEDRWLPGTASTCSGYQTTVENAVKEVEAQGMIAIIDLHWSDQGNSGNATGQQCMPDANSVTFWQQVANVYKGDPNVWFELYNEPYPPGSGSAAWSLWQNGGTVTCNSLVGGHSATWNAPGMQKLVNTIRAAGANNIIIAGGLAFSSVLSGAPSLTGGNVAYAIHIYRQGSGFSSSGWDGQIGSTDSRSPVVATEFGDQVCDGQTFDQQFLNYLRSHGIGYTGWAWFVQGCTWPSLITDAAGDCNGGVEGCAIQADMKTFTTVNTPSPTPIGTPTPTPTPTPTRTPTPTPVPTPTPLPTPTPTPSPKPTPTPPPPTTSPTPTPSPLLTGAIKGIAGKCLDNYRSARTDGNLIDLYTCNGTGAQIWTVNRGTAAPIVNHNGYCLDVYHSGTTPGTKVQLYQCNGTSAQQWVYNANTHTIINPHSGLCLDDKYSNTTNGNPIWIYTCNGSAAQKWTVY